MPPKSAVNKRPAVELTNPHRPLQAARIEEDPSSDTPDEENQEDHQQDVPPPNVPPPNVPPPNVPPPNVPPPNVPPPNVPPPNVPPPNVPPPNVPPQVPLPPITEAEMAALQRGPAIFAEREGANPRLVSDAIIKKWQRLGVAFKVMVLGDIAKKTLSYEKPDKPGADAAAADDDDNEGRTVPHFEFNLNNNIFARFPKDKQVLFNSRLPDKEFEFEFASIQDLLKQNKASGPIFNCHSNGQLVVSAEGGLEGPVPPELIEMAKSLAHVILDEEGIEWEDLDPEYQIILLIMSLEIYGFWLGDGTFQITPSVTGIWKIEVKFANKKPRDIVYIRNRLTGLGLRKDVHFFEYDYRPTGCFEFVVKDKEWTRFFASAYAYKYRRRGQPIPPEVTIEGFLPGEIQKKSIASAERAFRNFDGELEEEYPEAFAQAGGNYDVALRIIVTSVSSVKWLLPWCFELPRDYARALLDGLCEADGLSSKTKEKENETRGNKATLETTNRVNTSSTHFRDQLIVLAHHAGFTAFYKIHHKAGDVVNSGLDHAVEAGHHAWQVCFSLPFGWSQPTICSKNLINPTQFHEQEMTALRFNGQPGIIAMCRLVKEAVPMKDAFHGNRSMFVV